MLATTGGQADALVRGGTLGQGEGFRRAVPDAAAASTVVFVDLTRIRQVAGEDISGDEARALSRFGALGISVQADGKGGTTLRARLTTR